MSDTSKRRIGLRLIDGSEVIGYTHKGEFGPTTFSQLLRVAVHPTGQATLIPYVDIESFDEEVVIKPEHIILTYTPQGAVWEQHEGLVRLLKQKKTGLITPDTKLKL